MTSNIGDARIDALEGWVEWVPRQDWHLTGAVFVTDNEVTGSIASLSRANNRRLPETPSISARMGLIHDVPLGRETVLSARGEVAFVGPSVLG